MTLEEAFEFWRQKGWEVDLKAVNGAVFTRPRTFDITLRSADRDATFARTFPTLQEALAWGRKMTARYAGQEP